LILYIDCDEPCLDVGLMAEIRMMREKPDWWKQELPPLRERLSDRVDEEKSAKIRRK
jgi:hypothetical protein